MSLRFYKKMYICYFILSLAELRSELLPLNDFVALDKSFKLSVWAWLSTALYQFNSTDSNVDLNWCK